MNLAERVRSVLTSHAAGSAAPTPAPAAARLDRGALAGALGGEVRAHGDATCFVVERTFGLGEPVGRVPVHHLAAVLERSSMRASMLTSGAPIRTPFLFLDLETTGLSGGAGTYAFLVGCGSFSDAGFVVRQFLLTTPGDERAMLQAIARELAAAGALVSFNGKSFDAPLLESRYSFHRMAWSGGHLAHLDALHPARQFWGEASPASSCSLVALERSILGVRRRGDVPGIEIPARYFHFIRTGDPQPLAAVLEHNRLDLLSLAALTARLVELLAMGPAATTDPREAFALGRLYWRGGLEEPAHVAFARAVELTSSRSGRTEVRLAALHALAVSDRRARRYGDAAARWRALLDAPGCPPTLLRAAAEALAVHHEHRERDLAIAKSMALKSLESEGGRAWRETVHRRLQRIDRKIEREVAPPLQLLLSAAGPGD